MGPYAYAITIKPRKQDIRFQEQRDFESPLNAVSLVEFVGGDSFDIETDRFGTYEVTVYRSRKETNAERDSRVAGEKAYMAEYTRRQIERKARA